MLGLPFSCRPEVLFETCVAMKFVDDNNDDDDFSGCLAFIALASAL